MHGQYWHSETVNNLKTFLVEGCYVQLKSVKNMLFTITVLGYLHQQGVRSDSKMITEFKKIFAEYYVAPAILYREVPHMLHAKYQPNRHSGPEEEAT